MESNFNLDKPLMKFIGEKSVTDFTWRDACNSIQIFGGIGSGKTTGSGAFLASKLLASGIGGLVLTVKNDECDLWKKYCEQAGRSQDLIVVEFGGEHSFNVLQYESEIRPGGISISENILATLRTVIEASAEKKSGKKEEQFWTDALTMLLTSVLDLCLLAYGKVTAQLLYDIALTAPKKDAAPSPKPKPNTYAHAFRIAQKKVEAQIPSDPMLKNISDPDEMEALMLERLPDARLLKSIDDYFIENYLNLSDKTRATIEHFALGFLFKLLREPARSLMCANEMTFRPEDSIAGKIILLNIPVKKYDATGRDLQILYKYCWQRAMERRNLLECDKPVFLWADEAQHFLIEHDAIHQATARSCRIVTVNLTQNISNYHASMGGDKSEYRVKSLLATMGTHIFHSNVSTDTNEYASALIGKGFREDLSDTNTITGEFSSSETKSFNLEDMFRPEEFAYLKCGGPPNKNLVEAVVHIQGKVFDNGFNFKKVSFKQSQY